MVELVLLEVEAADQRADLAAARIERDEGCLDGQTDSWPRDPFVLSFAGIGTALAALAIIQFRQIWNDFLLPLIILTDQSNQTIPLAQYVFSSQFATNYPMAFSSYLMAMAPILIVYIFAQKWVVGGVMRGAVK